MKALVTLMLLCTASVVNAQPDTLWTRNFGGANLDAFHDVKCTPDGGYIAVGETWSVAGHDVDWFVVKTDSLGHAEWTRTFGGIYDDRAQSLVLTDDGGYTIAGWISGDTSRYQDFGLVHLSATGDSVWGRVYGGRRDDVAYDLARTVGGGYALAGFTGSFGYGGGGGRDYCLLKTDALGDSLWSRTYGGYGWDVAFGVCVTGDGGYALGGTTGSYGAGAYDMWLVRTNSNGDSLWSRTYGGGGEDEVRAMAGTADGGFILVGYTGTYGQGWENAYVVKADSGGVLQWSRAYGNVETCHAKSVQQLADGSFLIGGIYGIGSGQAPNWLQRTNASGDSLWCRIWGAGNAGINSVAATSNESYILAGLAAGNGGDAALTKTARDPLESGERARTVPIDFRVSVYPNPFNSIAILSYSLPREAEVELGVYDVTGRRMTLQAQARQAVGVHEIRLDASGWASGVYFVRVRAGTDSRVEKMVLLK